MQFVPDWTDFQLNNSMRLDIITEAKGLDSMPGFRRADRKQKSYRTPERPA
jgi:hypothetical protein